MSLLGVDLGSTSIKATAYNDEGEQLAVAYRQSEMQSPVVGWAQVDPLRIGTAFDELLTELGHHPRLRLDPVRAMSFSTSGDEVVLLDAAGDPLGPVLMSADVRGQSVNRRLAEEIPSETLRRTGLSLHHSLPIARLRWYAEAHRDLIDRCASIVGWGEFLMARLGLAPQCDYASAARWGMFDLAERSWIPELIEASRVDPAMLPALVACGSPVGQVSGSRWGEGFAARVGVAAGAYDQVCVALASSLPAAHGVSISTGTWEVLVSVDPGRPSGSQPSGVSVGHFPAPPGTYRMVASPCGTSVLDWFATLTSHDPVALIDEALEYDPDYRDPVFFLPHLQGANGAVLDPLASGALIGLRWGTSASQVLAGVLRGTAFELRQSLEAMGDPGSGGVILNSGGGARSHAWRQLKADVLNRPIARLSVDEPGCLAAAILAGVSCGVFDTPLEAVHRLVHPVDPVEPRPAHVQQLHELYGIHLAFQAAVQPLDAAIAQRQWSAGDD